MRLDAGDPRSRGGQRGRIGQRALCAPHRHAGECARNVALGLGSARATVRCAGQSMRSILRRQGSGAPAWILYNKTPEKPYSGAPLARKHMSTRMAARGMFHWDKLMGA